jgi:hypothetical protein
VIEELLFDERTGRYIGYGSGGVEGAATPPTAAPGTVPDLSLDAQIGFRVFVTCTAVDRDEVPS